ncbi:Ig-like domain-containing protein [Gammaproteobacteria bacterium]|nr:Ig-like domain-containing protein [Gammaproteobacteria bacterium]
MKKFISIYLIFFISLAIIADDFSWGEEFQEGDTISAEVFNEIFRTIEKINRTVKDTDLVGTWSCDATTTRSTSGYTDKGSFFLLEDAQINFVSSGASTSLDTPYNVTTSAPSPLKRENSSFSGTYQLYKNMLFLKQSGDNNPRIYAVDIVSETRIELTFLETSATSFPASYSSFVVCDTTATLSNPPSDMTISQDGSSITVGWTDNSTDETGFKIKKRTSSETAYTALTTTEADVVTYTDGSVTEGTTYFYAVSAVNSNGDSRFSNPVSITVDATAPTVSSTSPTANSSVNIDDRSLTINFSEQIKFTGGDGGIGGTGAIEVTFTRGSNSGNYAEQTSRYGTDDGARSSFTATLAGSAECLKAGTTVSVTVDASYIEDLNGNDMESDFSYTYTVGNTANNESSWDQCGQTQ